MGPAMTWCMHTIGWLELGEPQKAYDNIKKTFDNVASDFQVVLHFMALSTFLKINSLIYILLLLFLLR